MSVPSFEMPFLPRKLLALWNELHRRPGELASAASLIKAMDSGRNVSPAALRVQIFNLRGRIIDTPWRIEGVRGQGYRIVPRPPVRTYVTIVDEALE